jgi:hypothetical protein
MLVNAADKFVRVAFDNEAEIEKVVQDFAEDLFGPNIIYLPQTRISTIGGKGTIPDAIVIDVESQEWYVVEAERAVHGTWDHIAPQVSKQLAAVESSQTRERLISMALDQIKQSQQVRDVFAELGVDDIAVHGRLQAILAKSPMIAIPIDAIPKDLKEWVQTLRNDTKIWVIEKYAHVDNPGRILYSLPDETLPTLSTTSKGSGKVSTVTRGSAPWQEILEAGVLKDGDPLVMEYGPRGQPRQTFHGIARREGIEVNGQVKSASYAAVEHIRSTGSERKTANGWVIWKTPEGLLLDDLYQQLKARSAEGD